MIFWIDAQLPPVLAQYLAEIFCVKATAIRDLGLRDATDRAIFDAARDSGATLIKSATQDLRADPPSWAPRTYSSPPYFSIIFASCLAW